MLEIKEKGKKTPPLMLNVVDIEKIEPLHSASFLLVYYEYVQEPSGGLFGSKKSSQGPTKQIIIEEEY